MKPTNLAAINIIEDGAVDDSECVNTKLVQTLEVLFLPSPSAIKDDNSVRNNVLWPPKVGFSNVFSSRRLSRRFSAMSRASRFVSCLGDQQILHFECNSQRLPLKMKMAL